MKRNLMKQVERVRKHASNLITGIAVVGAPMQTAASGSRWWTISLKTRCLGWQSRETNGSQEPLGARSGVQFLSVTSDWRETISRVRARTTSTPFQNFGFLLTTPSKASRIRGTKAGDSVTAALTSSLESH